MSDITSLMLVERDDLKTKLEWLKSNYHVLSDKDAHDADALIGFFAEKLKSIETKKEPITSATWKAHKAALAIFKDPEEFCASIISYLKQELAGFTLRRNAAMQGAIQQRAIEMTTAPSGPQQAVAQVVDTEPLEFTNVSTKEAWGFRVVDVNLVPNQLCVKTVNLRLVEIEVQKGARQIPGIEIYPKVDARRKGKRDG